MPYTRTIEDKLQEIVATLQWVAEQVNPGEALSLSSNGGIEDLVNQALGNARAIHYVTKKRS